MTQNFTMAQLKELFEIHENTSLKYFQTESKGLESKFNRKQDKTKELKSKAETRTRLNFNMK